METKINNIKVNYNIKGKGENILILHGWGCNLNIFNNMVNHLSLNNKVYILDLPGFGKTDEPTRSWNIDSYVDFIIEFIRFNNIKELTLIGHSFGGRIIIKMCSKSLPFKVNKIILLGSAGIKPKENKSISFKTKILKVLKKLIFNRLVKKIFPSLLDKIKSKMGSEDYRNASPIMREVLVNTINEDLTKYLPNVKAPTLLIWGEMDTATPLEDAYKMDKLIPDSGLVILKGKTHYAFLEDEATVFKVIDSFLGGK